MEPEGFALLEDKRARADDGLSTDDCAVGMTDPFRRDFVFNGAAWTMALWPTVT